jgi:hypothetical protein
VVTFYRSNVVAAFKMESFNIKASIDLDTVRSHNDVPPAFKVLPLAFSEKCRIYIIKSTVEILCSIPPIVFFFRANLFLLLGAIHRFKHGVVYIWKYHNEDYKFSAKCTPSFVIYRTCTVSWCKYWVSLNQGLGGVGSSITAYKHAPLNRACIIFVVFTGF